MYIFIFESLGTMELLLIAVVALIVFGPRKLPTMARKAGQMMKELRSVSSDFRTTWEKEINFEETNSIKEIDKKKNSNEFFGEEKEFGEKITNDNLIKPSEKTILPEIKEVSSEEFNKIIESQKNVQTQHIDKANSEKRDWF